MTPGARVAAAIEVLDGVLGGQSAERLLTRWARGARYAGSGDRAAVRDHVFAALRRLRSCQAIGGGGGRGAMIGSLVQDGQDPATAFTGQGHAPPPLDAGELARIAAPRNMSRGERLDLPDWLLPIWDRSLGERSEEVAGAMRHRAPVHLRANLSRTDAVGLIRDLARDGIEARRLPLSPSAVELVGGGRALRRARAMAEGLAEPQDAASQAIADLVPDVPRMLDYCAGGGGKALAIAARTGRPVDVHDADPARMADMPGRARAAGADLRQVVDPAGPYDAVLCDVPCSGSGAWRRQPEAKWRLTEPRLDALNATQDAILDSASRLVAEGGRLIYATCSMLDVENGERVHRFLDRRPYWRMERTVALTPLDGGDGFYGAVLTQRRVER